VTPTPPKGASPLILRSVAEQLALLLGIFIASGVQNALSTIYSRSILKGWRMRASTVGTLMAALSIFSWHYLFREDSLSASPALVSYLAGDWVGTFFGLKLGDRIDGAGHHISQIPTDHPDPSD